METTARQINTPLETTDAAYVKKEILLVPILRAGLGMVNGIVKIWKKSRVGVLGMYRDDHTLQPVDYYLHLPDNIAEMTVFLVDPMLATGGSAVSGIDTLKEHGAKQLSMIILSGGIIIID
ncbi:MAG: uracil phosphoribosyltransferase [Aliifodinibius sp.]|nr:uracil phosphoribosyltransferase [Fodinibius sp.]